MKPKSHLVERIDREVDYELLPEAIEQGYMSLNERAQAEGYLIVAVVQSAHTYYHATSYTGSGGESHNRILILITAQVVNRELFESQQRRAALTGRPPVGMN